MAEGTKRQRSPGVWELRAYIGRDPATGRPRQKSRTFHGGARAAATALRALLVEVDAGEHVGTQGTVGGLLDAWQVHQEQRCRPNTIRSVRTFVRCVKPEIGHLRLDKLDASHLDALYTKWLTANIKESTVRQRHRYIVSALEVAVEWGWLTANPGRRAHPPSADVTEVQPPTIEQVKALILAAEKEDPQYGTAFRLVAWTGLRAGELCGLRWSDIDLERGNITVRRSISRGVNPGTTHVGDPKTKKGRRKVPLDELAVGVLRAHRMDMEDRAGAEGVSLVADPYVFSMHPNGKYPIRPDALSKVMARARKKAGVPATKLHDLRHYLASLLIDGGLSVRQVAAVLGHSKATMTLDVYSHLFESKERDAEIARVAGGPWREPLNP